jgi:murein DD-endopeptidase MepM/ murein hydrolase activator NlpD
MSQSSKAAAVAVARPLQIVALMALGVMAVSLPGVSRSATEMVGGLAPDAAAAPLAPAWTGEDVTGDGVADFANPTGKPLRTRDRFGFGWFGAVRDHGGRKHEGGDYVAAPGQDVIAPITGVVTKIGYAYAGDTYRYVEIVNPETQFEARVFYVQPTVKVGQAVTLGEQVGDAASLQRRYAGITDHVHLEILKAGRHLDPSTMIRPAPIQVARADRATTAVAE